MKILIIKTSSGFVDVTEATYNLQEIGLARAFNRQGHKCDVVYWGGKNEKVVDMEYDENKFFQVYYLKAIDLLKNGIYSNRLIELTKNYDIVHCGGYDQLESWILARKIPEKLVIYNGTYYSEFNVNYNRKCKIFDKFFLPRYKKKNICFDTKSRLSAKFLKDRGINDVTAIGVGIDLEQLKAKKMIKSEFATQIQEQKDKGIKFVTYIGRIEPRRNIIFLLEVFKEIAKEKENIKLLMIGKGEEKYKNECFNKIKQLGIEDKIIYKEYMKQEFLPKIYNLSDVFLLPTRYEIFGMVLLEAMYFNVPVVTTYNGGSDMLIDNNSNGIIIKDFNVENWKNKSIELLENKVLSDEICRKAKEKIEKEFTWDALVPKFIELFNKILKKD